MGKTEDEIYMRRAIELAKKGVGWTNPNPMVGSVVVKDGEIIAEGYHERCGEFHAERNALTRCEKDCTGATIYVTLEPCCHSGKTPPCTDIILEKGIARVVIGSRDPNPLVAGKGAEILRNAGLLVEEDFLREECDALNPVFFHYITKKTPYVVMKYAMTLDGKIASRTGASKWITGEKAREHVHSLRGKYACILAGIGTVLADDPMLNCRVLGAHQPTRVIVDSNLRIPMKCQIVQTARRYPTIVACSRINGGEISYDRESENRTWEKEEKRIELENAGVIVWEAGDEKVDIITLMKMLGQKGFDSVLVEGGGEIHEAFLQSGCVNHVCAYIAPKLMGGKNAPTPIGGYGFANPDEAMQLEHLQVRQFGEDVLLEFDVKGGQ